MDAMIDQLMKAGLTDAQILDQLGGGAGNEGVDLEKRDEYEE